MLLKNCATRVWCRNCIGTALSETDGALWRIVHTKNAPVRLEHAARGLRALVQGYDAFGQLANVLASTSFSDGQMKRVVDRVLPVPVDGKSHPRLLSAREKMLSLFETGVGIEGPMRGTAWAAVNALVEHADHHRAQRAGAVEHGAARLESIWVGTASRMKEAGLRAVALEAGVSLVAA